MDADEAGRVEEAAGKVLYEAAPKPLRRAWRVRARNTRKARMRRTKTKRTKSQRRRRKRRPREGVEGAEEEESGVVAERAFEEEGEGDKACCALIKAPFEQLSRTPYALAPSVYDVPLRFRNMYSIVICLSDFIASTSYKVSLIQLL